MNCLTVTKSISKIKSNEITLENYKGTFEQFMDPQFITKKDDFLAFELEDQTLIPHAIDQLRVLYPRLLQLTYSYLLNQQSQQRIQKIQSIEQMDTPALFAQFYQDMKNIELSSEQRKVVLELLEKVGEDHEGY